MELTSKVCPRCGKTGKIIKTNNPLVGEVCLSCVAKAIDFNKVEDIKLLSETLRINFNPSQFYLAQMNSDTEEEALEAYFEYLSEEDEIGINPKKGKVTTWDKIDEEWNQIVNFHELYMAIPIFKEEFIKRTQAKWGYNFSYEQLMRLENLYTATLKSNNITTAIKKDLIKKAVVISIQIDDLILEGDGKKIKELTTAYGSYLTMAGISGVEEVNDDDSTIKTVADLVSYLERRGYQVSSDFVEDPDIVDMTLNNIIENTRLIMSEKTGLDIEMRDIIEKAKGIIEEDISEQIYEREALNDSFFDDLEKELDDDLDNEEEEELDVEDIGILFNDK